MQEGFCIFEDDEGIDDRSTAQSVMPSGSRAAPTEVEAEEGAGDPSREEGIAEVMPELIEGGTDLPSEQASTVAEDVHVQGVESGQEARQEDDETVKQETLSVKSEQSEQDELLHDEDESNGDDEVDRERFGKVKEEAEEEDIKPPLELLLGAESRDLYYLIVMLVQIDLRHVPASTAAQHLKTTVAHVKKIVEKSGKYPATHLELVWEHEKGSGEPYILVKK